jgi:predicted DsbA family dithiol-disulfide isomerase
MRAKESIGVITNVLIIAAVGYALLRPTGPIGSVVVQRYQGWVRQKIVVSSWQAIASGPRVDSAAKAIAFVEFADYECPACRTQYPLLHKLLNDPRAGGLGFRNLPLSAHLHAEGAARTAICAEKMGKFAAMHERLFTTEAWIADTNWTREALAVGIRDTAAFRACRTSPQTTARLQADIHLADTLNIQSTPSFVSPRQFRVGIIPDSMYLRVSMASAGQR